MKERELELIKEYLWKGNTSQLKQLLSESRPEDLAELFPLLEREEQLHLIDLLDDEEAGTHKKTEHYLKWRETVADWMARLQEGVPHKVIAPKDRNRW